MERTPDSGIHLFPSLRAIAPLLGILAAGLLAFGSIPSAVAADWTGQLADQQISFDDNEYSREVQIALDGFNEILHAFWGEDAPSTRELHHGRSTDLGSTWSCTASDRVISFPDGNPLYEEPAVAIALDAGIIVVVWSEDDNATAAREVHYGTSTDDGLSFSSEVTDQILSDPTTAVDSGVPSVAIDRFGVIHVVWQQLVGGVAEVHYSRSSDLGATWSGASGDRVISFPDGNGAITPKLMVGDEERLIVVWREDDENDDPVIHLGISDDGGDTWSSETADREISQPVSLMTNLAASSAPLTVLDLPDLFVVYTASFDLVSPFHYEVYLTHSTDNGNSWTGESATTAISYDEDHTRSASNPDVFYSPCGGTIAVWDEEEDVAGTNEQHISHYRGGVWSGATADYIVSLPDGENGYNPSITGIATSIIVPGAGVDPSDTWIAWTEFSGGGTDNYEVHLSGAPLCSASDVPLPHLPGSFQVQVLPNPTRGAVRFELEATTLGTVAIEIFDASGRSIRRLSGEIADGGKGVLTWDGADANGQAVPKGIYHARVRSETGVRVVPVVQY